MRLDLKTQTQRDLWVLPLEGGAGGKPGKAYPWLATPFNEFFAKFSPDGRWVAYQADESGRFEIYVAAFPGPGGSGKSRRAGAVHQLRVPVVTSGFYLYDVPPMISGSWWLRLANRHRRR